jgi:hypothetical protein
MAPQPPDWNEQPLRVMRLRELSKVIVTKELRDDVEGLDVAFVHALEAVE